MAFPELKREGTGPQRGWDTCCQSHSKLGKETVALGFVATENLSVHQLRGDGWVESGLKPGGAAAWGQRVQRQAFLSGGWKNQAFLSFCPGPWLPLGSKEV